MLLRKNQEGKVNLVLEREIFTDQSIIGRLYLNEEYVCDTLENPYTERECYKRLFTSYSTGSA